MKYRVLTLIALMITFHVFGQKRAEAIKELDAYVARTCHYLGDCPYAIVVSKNGEIIFEKYEKGAGALGEITNESKWQLFSISKSFASALMLTLVQNGKISLDDPVSKYLPAFKTKGNGAFDRRTVTIRNLASHTSGAAVGGNKTPLVNPANLDDVEIITLPGKDFMYSGLGMHLLEKTIEAATGRDMGDLMDELVIKPLNLTSAGYVYDDKGPTVLPLNPTTKYFSKKGDRAATGLFINARDLNTFGQFWMNPTKLFSPQLRNQAWKWHGTRDLDGGHYGLLWWLFEDQKGYVMSGLQYKINAVIPDKKVVITVIRLPQTDPDFEFWPDKNNIVKIGNKL